MARSNSRFISAVPVVSIFFAGGASALCLDSSTAPKATGASAVSFSTDSQNLKFPPRSLEVLVFEVLTASDGFVCRRGYSAKASWILFLTCNPLPPFLSALVSDLYLTTCVCGDPYLSLWLELKLYLSISILTVFCLVSYPLCFGEDSGSSQTCLTSHLTPFCSLRTSFARFDGWGLPPRTPHVAVHTDDLSLSLSLLVFIDLRRNVDLGKLSTLHHGNVEAESFCLSSVLAFSESIVKPNPLLASVTTSIKILLCEDFSLGYVANDFCRTLYRLMLYVMVRLGPEGTTIFIQMRIEVMKRSTSRYTVTISAEEFEGRCNRSRSLLVCGTFEFCFDLLSSFDKFVSLSFYCLVLKSSFRKAHLLLDVAFIFVND